MECNFFFAFSLVVVFVSSDGGGCQILPISFVVINAEQGERVSLLELFFVVVVVAKSDYRMLLFCNK
jgi:hypothetical protein